MSTFSVELNLPNQISGLIFDCDGLITDTERLWTRVLTEWVARHNLPEVPLAELTGKSVEDAADLFAGLSDRPAEQIRTELADTYMDLIYQGVDPLPGAVDFINRLAGTVPIALATNSYTELGQYHLRNLNILQHFDAVIGLDQVQHGKPAPEIYELAASKLGVDPRQCVAFEDSIVGSRSAWDANMFVVGVNADPSIALSAHARAASFLHPELVSWQPVDQAANANP